MKQGIIKLVGHHQNLLHKDHLQTFSSSSSLSNSSLIHTSFLPESFFHRSFIIVSSYLPKTLMSRSRLTKKLQPAKKAWRSFSNRAQSKVNELNIPRAIRTTIQRLVSTFHSLRHFISTKARRHRSLPTRPYYYYNSSSSYHHVQRKNFSAIRIDDLFAEPSASSSSSSFSASGYATKGETRSRGEAEMGKKDLGGKGESSNGLDTVEDAWKVVVAKSPNLQVDEKAEEFIKKFHEDMKLQKERSLLEFQERLARGT